MSKIKLTKELVPKTEGGENLRAELSKMQWQKLRQQTVTKANYRCECCGGVLGYGWHSHEHPYECHEIWKYYDDIGVQQLVGLQALCKKCHQVKHIGLAKNQGRYDEALQHLMKVNDWVWANANNYVIACFLTWKKRSKQVWVTDMSWLYKLKEVL